MTIYEQLKEVLNQRKGEIVSSTEVKDLLLITFGTNKDSVLLSDYCYNRYNDGISFSKHLFQYINRNSYMYLGEHVPFTGLIYHKIKGEATERIVGEWIDGTKYMTLDGISIEQVRSMYIHYNDLLRYEVHVLRSKPTELRHLLGRIGEFLCVLETGGKMALNANEPGYDVVDLNGRKISVKTTAQANSFISFNRNTFHLCDDVYIVQFKDDLFQVLYYGAKENIEASLRLHKQTFELDLSKLASSKNDA